MHKFTFLLVFSLLFCQQPTFEDGIKYYNARSAHSIGTVTDDQNILKAIKIFESQLNSSRDLEVALYLVKSYYYMAQYVLQDYEENSNHNHVIDWIDGAIEENLNVTLNNSFKLTFKRSLTCVVSCLIASLIISIDPSILIFSSRISFNFISSSFSFLFISLDCISA